MKKDISNREDLLKLLKLFYNKLLGDRSISYLFTDIAKIDLPHHLDILVNFWDSVLFQNDVYRSNANKDQPVKLNVILAKHIAYISIKVYFYFSCCALV